MTQMEYQSVFKKDVIEGLSRDFYDDEGSRLFQKIMHLEEYYLPRLEIEIIKNKSAYIIQIINKPSIEILELGAGDGTKTVEFLDAISKTTTEFSFIRLIFLKKHSKLTNPSSKKDYRTSKHEVCLAIISKHCPNLVKIQLQIGFILRQ